MLLRVVYGQISPIVGIAVVSGLAITYSDLRRHILMWPADCER